MSGSYNEGTGQVKHPSEYATVQLGGYHVMVVDPGTTIRDETSGREETVDDSGVVFKGPVIYCTDLMFNGLKRAIEAQ